MQTDELNNRVRRIVLATALVTTLAGGSSDGFVDGVGTSAAFSTPDGIAIDSAGAFAIVVDTSNEVIRRIDLFSSPAVTTIAGLRTVTGWADGRGTVARFFAPHGVALGGASPVAYIVRARMRPLRFRGLLHPPCPYVSPQAEIGNDLVRSLTFVPTSPPPVAPAKKDSSAALGLGLGLGIPLGLLAIGGVALYVASMRSGVSPTVILSRLLGFGQSGRGLYMQVSKANISSSTSARVSQLSSFQTSSGSSGSYTGIGESNGV